MQLFFSFYLTPTQEHWKKFEIFSRKFCSFIFLVSEDEQGCISEKFLESLYLQEGISNHKIVLKGNFTRLR